MRTEPRILISGDPAFRSGVGVALGTSWTVLEAANVTEAADALLAARPAVVIVDLRPGADGHAVCRRIKGAAASRLLPVIGYIGADEADATIAALDAGADHVAPWPPRVRRTTHPRSGSVPSAWCCGGRASPCCS